MDNRTQQDANIVDKASSDSVTALRQDDSFDTQQWQRYIEQEIGFVLPDIQRQWLVNAIDRTAVANGLSALQLWRQLPNNDALRQQLLDKVLIHESRFFRHLPSIDFVTECALQHQRLTLTDDSIDETFRIWSVGCASGQETWSLAMSLASKQLVNYVILGTDVSQQALTKARMAQYDQRQKTLIPSCCQPFIHPLRPETMTEQSTACDLSILKNASSHTRVHWQIAPTLQQYVSFALHNIINQEPPTPHLQQVIICQNMLLYFRKFDQRDILTKLSEQCALGGYIVLAPGEALFWRPSNMRRIAHPQINAWQKISA